MLSVQASKILLKQCGLSDQDVDRYAELIEPQIEFHKFLMKQLDISSEKAEEKTKSFSKRFIMNELKKLKGSEISDTERFAIGAKSLKTFALKHNFDLDMSNRIETGMAEIMQILKKLEVKKEEEI